jgi:hypothetical protein
MSTPRTDGPCPRHPLPDEPPIREWVYKQIKRHWLIAEDQAAKAHRGSYFYKGLNAALGWVSIALAAAAAVVAIVTTSEVLTAVLAGVAALVGAIQQTISPASKARAVRDEAIEWERLATDFRHLAVLEMRSLRPEAARQALECLLDKRDELNLKYLGTRPLERERWRVQEEAAVDRIIERSSNPDAKR